MLSVYCRCCTIDVKGDELLYRFFFVKTRDGDSLWVNDCFGPGLLYYYCCITVVVLLYGTYTPRLRHRGGSLLGGSSDDFRHSELPHRVTGSSLFCNLKMMLVFWFPDICTVTGMFCSYPAPTIHFSGPTLRFCTEVRHYTACSLNSLHSVVKMGAVPLWRYARRYGIRTYTCYSCFENRYALVQVCY